jgi:UDP-N-acetylmuramate: L-alanyl-gamma-D-glutamyl-meso-diaminopimelate ligase
MQQLPKRIHITGICGVATSALAIAFHKKGVRVSGSDKGFFPPVSTALENAGVAFYAGWHPEKMISDEYGGAPDLVVIGTASGTQNPETLYARENGIRILSDAEVRGEFFAKKNSVVCVGTWGKTSSTTLLAHIFSECGIDPSYVIGGLPSDMDAAHLGDSEVSVIEGDEYKSSPWDSRPKFAHMKTTDLLLTSVSWDHADLYPTEASFFKVFNDLLLSLPKDGILAACTDHGGVLKILKDTGRTMDTAETVTYGKKNASYIYSDVVQTKKGLSLTVTHGDEKYTLSSQLLGTFQAENIAGCFALACEFGKKKLLTGSPAALSQVLSPEAIATAISTFKGLKRRLEKRLDGDTSSSGVTIIDDIAHSPEKATAVLSNIRSIYSGKIITIFEPNIGGRQRESLAKYDNAFASSDMVIIPRLTKLKIDSAKTEDEQPLEGDALAVYISKTHTGTVHMDSDDALVAKLLAETKKGDVIAFLGSHGFRGMIEATIEKLK